MRMRPMSLFESGRVRRQCVATPRLDAKNFQTLITSKSPCIEMWVIDSTSIPMITS